MFQVSNNSKVVGGLGSFPNVFGKNEKQFNLAMIELDSLSEQANLRVDECQERQQTFLDLSGCRIVNFPSNLFPFLTQLKELNLSNTSLQRLPSDLAWLLSLETLDLRGNPELNIKIEDIRRALPNVNILLDPTSVSPTSVSEPIGQFSKMQEAGLIGIDGGHDPDFVNALFKFQIGTSDVPTSSKKIKKTHSKKPRLQQTKLDSQNNLTLPVKQQIPHTMSQANAPVFEFGHGTIAWS